MRSPLRVLLALVALVVATLLLFTVVLIGLSEMGEVVIIETALPDGGQRTTRIWIVDTPDGPLVRGTVGKPWVDGALRSPLVRLERGGVTQMFRAVQMDDPYMRAETDRLMLEKYGIAERGIGLVRDLETSTVFRLETPVP